MTRKQSKPERRIRTRVSLQRSFMCHNFCAGERAAIPDDPPDRSSRSTLYTRAVRAIVFTSDSLSLIFNKPMRAREQINPATDRMRERGMARRGAARRGTARSGGTDSFS